MNVSLVVSAQDQTQSAIRSALGGIGRIAQAASKPLSIPLRLGGGALGLVRDINIGLAPLIRGIDNVVDRGARLEIVKKQFSALTGSGGRDLDALARRLQLASGNTLRLADAMQLANRGLGMGLGMQQIVTAVEFGVKKAAAIGEDGASTVERIINDLGKGTTRVLDDLGLLRNGVEGVEKAYNAIHGAKAFDSLGPAAQKAVVAAAAVAEMNRNMRGLGISGKETFFTWQGIKTQIGDSVDKLFLAIAGSKGMQSALGATRGFLRGIQTHFEGGGTVGELFTGKGGAPGLGQVAGGFLKDAGSMIWEGLKTGVPFLVDEIGKGLRTGADYFVNAVVPKLGEWRDVLVNKLAELIVKIGEKLQPLIDVLNKGIDIVSKLIPKPIRENINNNVGGSMGQLQTAWENIKGLATGKINPIESAKNIIWNDVIKMFGQTFAPGLFGSRDGSKAGLFGGGPGPQASAAGVGFMPGIGAMNVGPALAVAALGGYSTPDSLAGVRQGLERMTPEQLREDIAYFSREAAKHGGLDAQEHLLGGSRAEWTYRERIALAEDVMRGQSAGGSAMMAALSGFTASIAPPDERDEAAAGDNVARRRDLHLRARSGLRLNMYARNRMVADAARLRGRLSALQSGTGLEFGAMRADARKQAQAWAAEQRRQGFDVRPEDIAVKTRELMSGPLAERAQAISGELEGKRSNLEIDAYRRRFERQRRGVAATRAGEKNDVSDAQDRLVKKMEEAIEQMKKVYEALVGASNETAKAAA